MRFLYTLFLLQSTFLLRSQSLEIAPILSNPALKNYAIREDGQRTLEAARLTGIPPSAFVPVKSGRKCPLDYEGFLVAANAEIAIILDTFGLGNDPAPPVLTLINGASLEYGSASLEKISLTYRANANITGSGLDTVLVEFSDRSGKDTFSTVIRVRRKGSTVLASPKTVEAESVSLYCIDDELNFPGEMTCSEFLTSSRHYDGKGQQLFHFTTYAGADPCAVYYASRFPGADTVSVRICDAFQVCDTFLIPFTIKGDTIRTLPFFDDFSSYTGPYATESYWLDKHVFVNSTLAKDPPSIGFATFDGLDRRGDPYPILTGAGDRLTSKPIDLSGLSPSNVVSLRFFIAPKGYGLEPEFPDSLVVEFRNNQRKWVRMAAYPGIGDVPIDFFPPFVFKGIRLNDTQFFHEAFQFRFTAYTSPGGVGDLWHVDYVYLGANVDETNSNFNDVALTRAPTSLLKNYTSMPWKHFNGHVATELTDKFEAHFYNHFDAAIPLGTNQANYKETTTGTNFNQSFTLNESGENIPSKTPTTRMGTIPATQFQNIKNILTNNIPFNAFRNVETKHSLTYSGQTALFTSNDEVQLNTPFSDYFAHDDGTAEWQVFIKFATGGEQMASRFRANIGDTLRAVQFHFPHINGDVQNQLFNLRIWTGDPATNDPIYEQELLKPFYANNVFDTLQGFTTYKLQDFLGEETPVFIPAGDFYVGWMQVTPGQLGIPMGFDVQNPCDCNFSNINGQWRKFPSTINGSLMIRPVFSPIAPNNTSTGTNEPVKDAAEVTEIYPNPSSGTLNFKLKQGHPDDFSMKVYNQLGQQVAESVLKTQVKLHNVQSGVYLLVIENLKTGGLYRQKIIINTDRP